MQAKKPKNGKKLKPKSKEHYVNSKEFKAAIAEYYKTGVCADELGEMITKIANGLSYAPNFINYSYKDEMVGDAVVKMFTALFNKKFDINAVDSKGNKYNPFSYFTTIAFHAFINRIKKEKRHFDAVNEYKERVYEEMINTGEAEQKIYVRPQSEEDLHYD
jgi:hypothetical protein|tara:strand:+ start:4521 stop:5003 length:483 start_codon:yes stop_codon:yes gene_type:complete